MVIIVLFFSTSWAPIFLDLAVYLTTNDGEQNNFYIFQFYFFICFFLEILVLRMFNMGTYAYIRLLLIAEFFVSFIFARST